MISIKKTSNIIQAVKMLAKGYYNKIIEIETGMKYREILTIRRDILEMNILSLDDNSRGGRVTKNVSKIISNKEKYAFASIFASIYAAICEKKGVDPKESVDLDSLEEALTVLEAITESDRVQSKHINKWGVNEAYLIAREFINGKISERHCPKCRTQYFQLMTSHGEKRSHCHFCKK